MVQHDLKGDMLFLHTNLSPKWNLNIPGDFRAYTRRSDLQLSTPEEYIVDGRKYLEHLLCLTRITVAAFHLTSQHLGGL